MLRRALIAVCLALCALPAAASAQTQVVVPYSSSGWKYQATGTGGLAGFQAPLFDDSAWATGAMPFGALISQIVHVTDPVAYLASLGLIVAVCLLAAWIPAARAAKVDPMRTLRQE